MNVSDCLDCLDRAAFTLTQSLTVIGATVILSFVAAFFCGAFRRRSTLANMLRDDSSTEHMPLR